MRIDARSPLWAVSTNDSVDRVAVAALAAKAEDDVAHGLVAARRVSEDAARHYCLDNHEAFVGPLWTYDAGARATFVHGTLFSLELIVTGWGHETAAIIDQLQRRGALAALRHLRIVGSTNFDHVLASVCAAPLPELVSLRMGPTTRGAGRQTMPLQQVLDHLPKLQTLAVEMPPPAGPPRHAALTSLSITFEESSDFDAFSLEGLPQLHTLAMSARAPAPAGFFERVITRELTELNLAGSLVEQWQAATRSIPPSLLTIIEPPSGLKSAGLRGKRVMVEVTRPSPDADPLLTPIEQAAPRRFELDGRFWTIHRDVTTVHPRNGKIGGKGTARAQSLSNAYAASRMLRAKVAEWRAKGYVEVVPSA